MKVKSVERRLIGERTGLSTQTTNILLTDPLGSVLATFSNTAGSAALTGNQAYGPYGHLRYNAGGLSGMATSKGFTGQYSDAFSGLDYYDSRYYQPAVGVFLSADSKEGNTAGMDPYMYVGGNPETYNDPTGQFYGPPSPGNGNPPPTCVQLNDCWSSSGGSGHPPTSGNGSGGGNPKIKLLNLSNSQSCDDRCKADKQLITDYINHQRLIYDTIVTLIGDVTSGLADIASAIIDAIGSAWGAFALDVASALVRVGSVLADLRVFGIVSLPSWFGSAVGILKQVVNIVDGFRGLLDLFNPVGSLSGFLEHFVSQITWAKNTAGILDFVSGVLSPGVVAIIQNVKDVTQFNNQLNSVDSYSPQQALKTCRQDYISSPGMC